MAARIRAHHWAATPLGPIQGWPDRFRLMVEQVLACPLVSSLVCGPDQLLIYNDAAARLYGDRHPAVLGRPLPDSFPEGWRAVAPFYERAWAGETVEVRRQPLDTLGEGEAADLFDALLLPVRDEAGRVAMVHMAGLEYGAALRAERTLRAEDAQFRQLFDALDEGFCTIELLFDDAGAPIDYRFLSANAAFPVQVGLSDVVGRKVSELVPGQDAHRFETYARILRTGVPERFEDRSDAADRWFDVFAMPVGRPGQRQLAVLFKDVLAQKRAEQALRRSEQQQRLMLELVPAVLWWADPEGRSLAADARWRFHSGRQLSATRDYGWFDVVHPDDVDAARAAFDQAFASGEPLERQLRIHNDAGEYRWHLIRHVPVRDDAGQITRWFGAATDIHDLHQLQQRQEGMVAELQHRTRNLIAVVSGLSGQTLREAATLDGFADRFGERLAALARVQGLLSNRSADARVTFDELLRSELAALGVSGDRVDLAGPAGVALRSSSVQTLALALHELAVDARRRGVPTGSDGRLSVRWTGRRTADGTSRLSVEWREAGASVAADEDGYARELVEHALPHQLRAATRYDRTGHALLCTIDLPVPATGDG